MKNNINYLCIDDQRDDTIVPLLDKLAERENLVFQRNTPKKLEDQLTLIDQYFKVNSGDIGLLLDLRLDMEADDEGNRVTYRGPTLAQELRTRMAEGALPSFPIVLWSVDAKFRLSYSGEESSHDLFDDVFGKDGEILGNPIEVSKKLSSLARGYSALRKPKGSTDAILLGNADLASSVYLEFLSEFNDILDHHSTHEVAQLILNELIRKEGLLITHRMLAARLGVDIDKSGASWDSLLAQLLPYSYSGIFYEAWPRWWWFKIEDWWANLSEKMPNLRRLSAAERVLFLNEKMGFSLIQAEPILPTYSTKYSTICAGTYMPLDPLNGLKLLKRGKRSWQDISYVSSHAALERINREAWRLDPLERDRFARMKATGF